MWDELGVAQKNHYIRNSDAYKLKNGVITQDQLDKKEVKKAKSPAPSKKSSSVSSSDSSSNSTKRAKRPSSEIADTPSSKRSVKRKAAEIIEVDRKDDSDWVVSTEPKNRSIKLLDNPLMPQPLPPLKFKKKSRTTSETPDILPAPPLTSAISSPRGGDKPPAPKPESTVKVEAAAKEATPPPPLRKIENNVTPTATRKSSFKPICLQEGCYEEAKTEPDRGKYWCTDECCIEYTKTIFNAWVGARRGGMLS